MTEIERYEAPTAAPATVAPLSAAELDVIMRQADILAASDIIPRDYRRKPANIVVAAITGRTFGWDAVTAMRNGHVIEGTWTIKPEAMLALVRRAGHSVTGETSPTSATVRGKRGDTGDEMTVTFSLDDAARAGLARKAVWQQYPQAMCWARAVSQLCRMLFADVTLGLSYTPEELGANVDESGDVIDVPAISPAGDPFISPANAERLRERCAERDLDVAEVVLRGTGGRTDDPAQVRKDEIAAVKAAMDDMTVTDAEIVGEAEPGAEADVVAADAPGSEEVAG